VLIVPGIFVVVAVDYAVKLLGYRMFVDEVKNIAVQDVFEEGPDKSPGEEDQDSYSKVVYRSKSGIEVKASCNYRTVSDSRRKGAAFM
jgi:hypothetical protein